MCTLFDISIMLLPLAGLLSLDPTGTPYDPDPPFRKSHGFAPENDVLNDRIQFVQTVLMLFEYRVLDTEHAPTTFFLPSPIIIRVSTALEALHSVKYRSMYGMHPMSNRRG